MSRVDSIRVVDSVYIDRIRIIKEKGDTVYVFDTKTKYKYCYQDRVKIDTAFILKEKTVEIEVEKELTRWQSFKMKVGGYALSIILLALIYLIVRLVLKIK